MQAKYGAGGADGMGGSLGAGEVWGERCRRDRSEELGGAFVYDT